jgi:hypothetical protein
MYSYGIIMSLTLYFFFQDWWLSPELYLRRPPAHHPEWRLDRLLKRKAEQGVKIHVIVYKEVPAFFAPFDSFHAYPPTKVTQTMTMSSKHTKVFSIFFHHVLLSLILACRKPWKTFTPILLVCAIPTTSVR